MIHWRIRCAQCRKDGPLLRLTHSGDLVAMKHTPAPQPFLVEDHAGHDLLIEQVSQRPFDTEVSP